LISSYTSSFPDLSVETKEVKLTPKTDIHDAAVKLKSVQKFLEKAS
jgi:translation initiation factor IF-3